MTHSVIQRKLGGGGEILLPILYEQLLSNVQHPFYSYIKKTKCEHMVMSNFNVD